VRVATTRTRIALLRRAVGISLLAAFLPSALIGCFGNFELTKKVWRINKQIDQDRWVQEVAFLVLAVVPVYGGALFLDVVLFNSLEFWTGKNPVLAEDGARKVVRNPTGGQMILVRIDADTLGVTLQRSDGTLRNLRLAREPGAVSAWDTDGHLLARVASVRGRPAVVAGTLLAE
jgi:hypothetical protein